jgi:hypothetical protein
MSSLCVRGGPVAVGAVLVDVVDVVDEELDDVEDWASVNCRLGRTASDRIRRRMRNERDLINSDRATKLAY